MKGNDWKGKGREGGKWKERWIGIQRKVASGEKKSKGRSKGKEGRRKPRGRKEVGKESYRVKKTIIE